MTKNPIVCITGATRGLGRAMVAEFINQGATVVGFGRTETKIADLSSRYGSDHLFSVVDITSENDVQRFAKVAIETVGVPDILINNAGVINRNAPLWEVPADEFTNLIDINVNGVASTIRAFVPQMIQRGQGVIVNFSSGWGRSTSPEVAPYCASKYAIEGLSEALAQELPPGLASVALNPGIINTEMLQSCFGESATNYPSPTTWAETAVPFILSLTAGNNGDSLTAP